MEWYQDVGRMKADKLSNFSRTVLIYLVPLLRVNVYAKDKGNSDIF